MTRVAILAYDKGALFELGCAVELFGLSRPEFADWYSCDVISFTQGALTMTTGVQLLPKHVQSLDDYDMLVVPSWPTDNSDVPTDLKSAIHQFHIDNKRIVSFCSGAFLLAELGLLDGRKATTHWRYAEKFKTKYKNTEYVDDVLYVYDGKIGCSAGSAAAIDLGIAIIKDDYGYQTANSVARRLVMSAHRSGGQSQFVETPVIEKPGGFSQALDWALKNITTNIDIETFAQQANMSRRTFDRKFRSSLNLTPNDWISLQRLNLAKQLIEGTSHSIDKVAQLSGFENAISMRHHFRKTLGISPTQYREQFGHRLMEKNVVSIDNS